MSRTLRRLQSRRGRARAGSFLVEGLRSANAALDAGVPVRFAVLSTRLDELGGEPLRRRLSATGVNVAEVTDVELAELADTVTPQGVVMVCEEPAHSLDDLGDGNLLIADAIQDPANLATMVRVAAAFGLGGIIALDGTVDPWNAKVVRGSAGGCFHTKIVSASWSDVREWMEGGDRELLGASTDGRDVAGAGVAGTWALAIGNEGAGLRPEIRAAAAQRLAIPIRAHSESLSAGVAAAILAYELSRDRAAARRGASRGC